MHKTLSASQPGSCCGLRVKIDGQIKIATDSAGRAERVAADGAGAGVVLGVVGLRGSHSKAANEWQRVGLTG